MKQAIISNQDNGDGVALQTPFNRDFINDLKSKIPYTDREWDRDNKVWLVSSSQTKMAIGIMNRYFNMIDAREKSADEIEEAQIEAEIEKIQADQEKILEQETYIESVIDKLDNAISRYSFQSKSAVRYAMIRDRALLQHSLDNARMSLDQLTELHVHGMAAALKLIDDGYTPPRGARL